MSRNWIITILAILGIGVATFIVVNLSNKSGKDNQTKSDQTTNEPSNMAPENSAPQNQQASDSGECKRNFDQNKMSQTVDGTGKVVVFDVKNFGKIKISVDSKDAPKTSENFLKLVNAGFYDCLTFHRIVKQQGFHLIQGGDPSGDGSGGPGYTVPAEIKLPHKRGSIAMARLGDQVNPNKDSSGSQFYITLEDIPSLDGGYTVFGQVVDGLDVADKIDNVDIIPGPFGGGDGSPKDKIVITKATIENQ